MDILNLVQARNLLRTVVVPDALRRFRDLREHSDEPLAQVVSRATQAALRAHAGEFPPLSDDQGQRIVTLYAELCAEAFEDEYHQSVQPKESLVEQVM